MARYYCWPRKHCNSCDTCQEYHNQQKDEKPVARDIPTTPWTKVDTDLFELKGKSYFVVVDHTTNFFDISLIPNKWSATIVTHTKKIFSKFGIPKKVVSHTKRIFSKFGIPKKVVTDNGPEYIGKDYKLFAKQWELKHDSSSPH